MIFQKGPSRWLLVILLLIATTVAFLDVNSQKFKSLKAYLDLAITPLQWFVDLPVKAADNLSDVLVSRTSLVAENNKLRREAILLEQRVLQNATLASENRRLRSLLNARSKLDQKIQMAELIGVSSDPFQHEILTNLGAEDGVLLGQSALDSGGVMGLVVSVSPVTSRIMLITDTRSAVPVEVLRTGYRGVVLGTGSANELTLDHVPNTEDIRVGDRLVTSGLGGQYPAGYPVAEIIEFRQEPGRSFAIVRAEPSALLDKSRYLLLVDLKKTPRGPLSNE